LQARKPEAKTYQFVLDYLHMTPAAAVFLEDNLDNAKGLAQFGLQTILVTSSNQMTTELRAIGLFWEATS
jgi:FMN phosphatase YigB (HAD superfamily)